MSHVGQRFSVHVQRQPAFQLPHAAQEAFEAVLVKKVEDRQKGVSCPIDEALPSPWREFSSWRETTVSFVSSLLTPRCLVGNKKPGMCLNCQKVIF